VGKPPVTPRLRWLAHGPLTGEWER
jgi:hypothetical protein